MRRENAESWEGDGELQTSTLQWNKNSSSELGRQTEHLLWNA
jgi:hypothetical protein